MSVGTAGAIQLPPASATVLGQGIKYPPTLDAAKGRLVLSWGSDVVAQSIQSICLTQPFERVMQPDYGAAVMTFEPIELARAKAQIDQQIATHEPRAKNVSVEIQPARSGEVLINISFNVEGGATLRTLTFPIFTPPATTGASL